MISVMWAIGHHPLTWSLTEGPGSGLKYPSLNHQVDSTIHNMLSSASEAGSYPQGPFSTPLQCGRTHSGEENPPARYHIRY